MSSRNYGIRSLLAAFRLALKLGNGSSRILAAVIVIIPLHALLCQILSPLFRKAVIMEMRPHLRISATASEYSSRKPAVFEVFPNENGIFPYRFFPQKTFFCNSLDFFGE